MYKIFVIIFILVWCNVGLYSQDTAIDSLEKKLSFWEQNDTTKVNILNQIAFMQYKVDPNKTYMYSTQAYDISDSLNYSKGLIEALKSIGYSFIVKGDYEIGIDTLQKCLQLANNHNNNRGVAYASKGIGFGYFSLFRFDSAQYYYEQSYDHFLKLGNKNEQSSLLENIGNIFYYQGNYPKTLDYYHQSLAMSENHKDTSAIAKTTFNIGNINRFLKDYELAKVNFEKAALLAKQIKNDNTYANCLRNIGGIYSLQKQDSISLKYYENAITIFKKNNEILDIALTNINIGSSFRKMGIFDKALENFTKAVPVCERYSQKYGLVSAYMGISAVYFSTDQFSRALKYVIKAHEITSSNNMPEEQKDVYGLFSMVYEKLGDYKLAYENHVKFKQTYDSLFNERRIRETTNLENRYKFEKEKHTIALQQQQKEAVHIAELKRQKQIRNLFIVGAIGFLVLGLIILKNLIQKRKSNLLLALQKDEIHKQASVLKQQNTQLIQLSSFKEDMTNMIVHDLKNPLSAILNIDLIEEVDDRVNIVKHSGYRMMNLIQNILDVYRYSSVKINLAKKKNEITNIINEVIEEIEFALKQKALKIECDFSHKIWIKADKTILHRILVNLLSNATKFAPNSSQITIKLDYQVNKELKISVHNSGPHIPLEKQKLIFEKFGQDIKKAQGKLNSTGLGLAFCKMAVSAHGGIIGVDSEENNGATFFFTIPDVQKVELNDEEVAVPGSITNFMSLVLTPTEKEGLQKLYPILQHLSVNEITTFRKALAIIKNERLGNNNWIDALTNSVYSCNQELYDNIVALIVKA